MCIKMRRLKKPYVVMLCLVIFLLILASLGALYINRKTLFPHWFGPKKFTGNIFGKPSARTDYAFPQNKPQFTAKVSAITSESSRQQSVTVYSIGGKKENPVFHRNFYDDGFHGKILRYTFSSDSTSFRQSGSLGTIGCGYECSMVWSNFYVWNPQQKAFILDNASHKDFFQQMLITYQTIDKRGCSTVGSNVVPNQSGISFTELYSKYPALKWYCNPTQGILQTNLMFFLKAEKAVQQIIAGKNIGSNDIQNISL